MKKNELKDKSFTVSRSQASYSFHPYIKIGREKLENIDAMKFLGVSFEPNPTFVNHINYVASRAA